MDNEQSVEDVDMITEESHEEVAESIELDEEDILEADEDDVSEEPTAVSCRRRFVLVYCSMLFIV